MPGADRQNPVAAHLNAIIEGFQRFIVEGVFAAFFLAGPDHRFMGIGQTLAAKVRHRVGFAPDDIVQDPKTLILQRGPDPKEVVIRADYPNSPGAWCALVVEVKDESKLIRRQFLF
jgi:hypothetical protein